MNALTVKALELDDTLAEAHTSLAYAKSALDWDWHGAEVEFKQALELNPNYLTAHHWYAYHLAAVGRLDEAIAEIKRAQEIDPFSLIINTDVGHLLYLARRYDEAIAQYQKVLEMDPNFNQALWHLGEVYERKGMHSEAIAELRKAVEIFGESTQAFAWPGHAYAASGQKDKALKIIAQLKSRPKTDYAYPVALIYTGLGEKDQAFAWLQKAFDVHEGSMALFRVDPMLDELRPDQRYADLLRRMRLAS